MHDQLPLTSTRIKINHDDLLPRPQHKHSIRKWNDDRGTLELAPEMTLRRAHVISDEVEAEVQAVFPGAEVIIHQDPHGVEEARAVFRR